MAAKQTAQTLDDNTLYDVDLTRPITVGRGKIRPGTEVQLKGKVIKDLEDGVATNIRPAATGADQS